MAVVLTRWRPASHGGPRAALGRVRLLFAALGAPRRLTQGGDRLSTATVIGQGWARLWGRGVFAVVATWAIVALVSIGVVAPAWAWWSGALSHTIDGARLLGSRLSAPMRPPARKGLSSTASRAGPAKAKARSMPTAAEHVSRRTASAATDRCSASR